MKKLIAGLLCLFLMPLFLCGQGKINIYLIGASTTAEYNSDRAPLTGWGMPLRDYFDSSKIIINNLAASGRSTRTFIEENRWDPVRSNLKKGDYVFIHFAHNDEIATKKSYTPPEEYLSNLKKFITETKDKGAIPVLFTAVARRQFDSNGLVVDTHKKYSDIVRTLATKENIQLIDLDSKSRDLLEKLGEVKSEMLYMHLEKGENIHYPEGKTDNTHFNELGARMIAELVVQSINELDLEIGSMLK